MGDRAPQLLVPALPEAGGSLPLPAEAVRHARVLRLGVGAAVVLFDGRGRWAPATITVATKQGFTCQTQASVREPAPARQLTMLVGVTKGDKLDEVVRMLTELSVTRIGLALCARTVPEVRRPDERRSRLARIALSACAQSGRARVPELVGPAPLLELAAGAPTAAARVVCWERAAGGLPPTARMAENSQIWCVVGPEGGLSEEEVAALGELGYEPAGLGRLILRAQTAAVAAAALLGEPAGP